MREIHYPSVDAAVADAPEGMTRFRIEVEDSGVALLTLDRPERLNAFSMGYAAGEVRPGGWSLFDRYMRALTQELKHDPAIKVVVITGAGRAFSAGADIKDWAEMEAAADPTASPFIKDNLLFDEHTAMMHIWFKQMVKPTIAMVNGPAVGMGADLASVADIRMVSDRAFFQWAHVLNGLVPADGAPWLLQKLVGQAKTFEWLMTGARVSPQEALAAGYANHVVPHDDLHDRTMTMARQIAALPARTVQATRFAINASADLSFQDSIGLAYVTGYATQADIRERIMQRAEAVTSSKAE
ncbi:enoyl-CoA hydratase/isomerase family protein [Brevundimonas sp. NPDC090276]|uniref:enoyl-CoA hydratase/isomerase family protein n=1 Tax=Brevundimonas sp. NPDC090276 TaxID=3363956 RepID=UPI00383A4216